MPLAIRTRIGPYEITGPLGAGGMGEVYRARDTKLHREVALKILPAAFAVDAGRLARFKREAQVLASLNHTNVATIYGVEETDGIQALVLELVEGPTLADRIAQGPIPLDEALPVARQIADALEAAHDHEIVHRDLKPSNIKLRPDGTVKVLDFGLAKALDPPGASVEASESPTITTPAMTQLGVLLGTAAYMSPEQARGQAVTTGADIWSFGCVLFEMLTGARAFGGEDTTETIAAVVRGTPEWSRLPAEAPDSIRRLLRRCVEKDRRRRLADIRDARLEIDDARNETPQPIAAPSNGLQRRERLLWSGVVVLLAAAAVAALVRRGTERTAPALPAEMRLEVTTPPTTNPASIALSPDGEKLAFVASSEDRSKLWLRSLVTGAARPLAGTDDATFPFWSPDSRSIGYFADDKLFRIDIDGGAPKALANAPVGGGGTWSRDHVIVYPPVPDAPLMRVPDTGGELIPLPVAAGPFGGQRFPQFLPDGRHLLYFMADAGLKGVYLGSIDSADRRRLFDADSAAVFVPPAHLIFLRAGTLFKQRFDPVKFTLEDNPAPIAQGVASHVYGAGAISASAAGSIAYRSGSGNRETQLSWFDRTGRLLGTLNEPDPSMVNPEVSPDGRRVAFNRSVDGNTDLWLLDLTRRVLSRFTTSPLPEIYAVWSPDGRQIAFGRPAGTPGFQLFRRPTEGAGQEIALPHIGSNVLPLDWSKDGRYLLYATSQPQGTWDIGALPVQGDGKPIVVTQTPHTERTAQFSPDSRWVAFESDESGRAEIYVQPFPEPGTRTIVSTTGGLQPRWSPDGKELFYVAPDGRLMSVAMHVVANGRNMEPSSPVPLFKTRLPGTHVSGSHHEYAIAPDNQRFLINSPIERPGSPITVVLNRTPTKD